MGTSTTSLQLYKPDPIEFVDVVAHVNNNSDRLENKIITQGAGPACVLRRDTNFNVPAGVDTAIPWTVSERNDSVGGNAMWVANATGVTIRKAGQYSIGMRGVYVANNTGTLRAGYIAVNGTDSGAGVISNAPAVVEDAFQNYTLGAGYGAIIKCQTSVVLAINDVVKATTYQDSAGALDIKSDTNTLQGRMRFWVIWEPPYIGS